MARTASHALFEVTLARELLGRVYEVRRHVATQPGGERPRHSQRENDIRDRDRDGVCGPAEAGSGVHITAERPGSDITPDLGPRITVPSQAVLARGGRQARRN